LNCKASTGRADSLYFSGNYFEASIEYERLVFNSENQANVNFFRFKEALCYKKLLDFNRALEVLQTIYLQNSDTLYQRVCYQQSLCHYLNGEPAKALWKIDDYLNRNPDTVSNNLFFPVKILCLNETFQWREAQACFLNYIQIQKFNLEKSTFLQNIVNDLYSKKKIPHIKSVKGAENWSRFLPGAGQIYSGYPGEGILNFTINVSILTFSAIQAINGFYITGYLAGLGFFNKTYQGGIKRSGILATRRSKELVTKFNSQINEIIRSNFM
jgi:tetratricopeptide (TPR) repeat protein